jgi:hypothetical protein
MRGKCGGFIKGCWMGQEEEDSYSLFPFSSGLLSV